jgi:hypothetical protein
MSESNKLIAEFMGLIIRDKEGNLPTSSQQHKLFVAEEWDKLYLVSPYSPNGPDYHKSWDYLMPVVEKILDISFQDENDAEDFYSIRDCIPDINHTHKAIVQFIKKYKNE